MNETGYLAEVFASYQGEGPWIGVPQIFIRLAGCSLGCGYCDTAWARHPHPAQWKMHEPGLRPLLVANPVSAPQFIESMTMWWEKYGPFHSFAFTGGEPLEQPRFVETLARGIMQSIPQAKILLETNGLHPIPSKKNAQAFHFISMDIKLPSATGKKGIWKKHEAFLKSIFNVEGCVKVVIVPQTTVSEIATAARMALRWVPEWDFILQPSGGRTWGSVSNRKQLQVLAQRALIENPRVRLIPQAHRQLGIA
jgi:organic radical activating enzyme